MHKELYFTPASLSSKSKELLNTVRDFRRRHDRVLAPGRAALLVLDMQDYFLKETSHAFVPSGRAIIPPIQALLSTFSTRHYPVIFTRHANRPEDVGLMAVWWQDILGADSPYSAITAELDMAGAIIVEKNQYDAFYGTHLEKMLRAMGVSQIVICGVMTHLCCETTARSAFMRGFEVFFCIDGTATYTEAFHKASLMNLAHGFAIPVLIEEVMSAFEQHEP